PGRGAVVSSPGAREPQSGEPQSGEPQISVRGVTGLPEVPAGPDLGALLADAVGELRDGDIVVVTSKIVSKPEGRTVAQDREAAIDAEKVRVGSRLGEARSV